MPFASSRDALVSAMNTYSSFLTPKPDLAHPLGGLPNGSQGLWAALAWQAQAFADHSQLQCHWAMDVADDLDVPDGPMTMAVFSIFREMLSNVQQHAHATRVDIQVRGHDGDISISVRDNGRGAPPSAYELPGAHGVNRMREQAALWGGWLYIDSRMGEGTTVILTMPTHPYRGVHHE
jgi:nitrate/nitrite-specific signal transduction histidine kinase